MDNVVAGVPVTSHGRLFSLSPSFSRVDVLSNFVRKFSWPNLDRPSQSGGVVSQHHLSTVLCARESKYRNVLVKYGPRRGPPNRFRYLYTILVRELRHMFWDFRLEDDFVVHFERSRTFLDEIITLGCLCDSQWVRDLTTECVEPNPGPDDIEDDYLFQRHRILMRSSLKCISSEYRDSIVTDLSSVTSESMPEAEPIDDEPPRSRWLEPYLLHLDADFDIVNDVFDFADYVDNFIYLHTQRGTYLFSQIVYVLSSYLPVWQIGVGLNVVINLDAILLVSFYISYNFMKGRFAGVDFFTKIFLTCRDTLGVFLGILFFALILDGVFAPALFVQAAMIRFSALVLTGEIDCVYIRERLRWYARKFFYHIARITYYYRVHFSPMTVEFLSKPLLLKDSPEDSWVRDLTRECIEPNPGMENVSELAKTLTFRPHPIQIQAASTLFQCIHTPDAPTFIAQFGALFAQCYISDIIVPFELIPDSFIVDDDEVTVSGETYIGGFSAVGEKFTKDRRIRKFLQLLDKFCSLNGIKKFVPHLDGVSFVAEAASWLYDLIITSREWYTTGVYPADYPLAKLEARLDVVETYIRDPVFDPDVNSPSNLQNMGSELSKIHDDFLRASTVEAPNYRWVLADIKRRIDVANDAVLVFNSGRKRNPPIAFAIGGLPGGGKTTQQELLFRVIASAMGRDYKSDEYIRMRIDKNGRADNLYGHHRWIDAGDIGQSNPNRAIAEWAPLQDLCDTSPYLVQKANLSDKGKVYANPLAVIVTTNSAGLPSGSNVDTIAHEMAVPAALRRRFHWLRFQPRLELDAAEVVKHFSDGTADDIVEFSVWKTKHVEGYRKVDDWYVKTLTYKQLLAYIREETVKHTELSKLFKSLSSDACLGCGATTCQCDVTVASVQRPFIDVPRTLAPKMRGVYRRYQNATDSFTDVTDRLSRALTRAQYGFTQPVARDQGSLVRLTVFLLLLLFIFSSYLIYFLILVVSALVYFINKSGYPVKDHIFYVIQPTTHNQRMLQYRLLHWRCPELMKVANWVMVFGVCATLYYFRPRASPKPPVIETRGPDAIATYDFTVGGTSSRVWARPERPSDQAWRQLYTPESISRDVHDLSKQVRPSLAVLSFDGRVGVGILLPPYVLLNIHTIKETAQVFTISPNHGSRWDKVRSYRCTPDLISRHPTKDIAFIYLPDMPAHTKSIANWFPISDDYVGMVPGAWDYVFHEEGEPIMRKYERAVMGGIRHCATGQMFQGIVGPHVVQGNSGSPLFISSTTDGKQHGVIGGICVQTSPGQRAFYVTVTRADIALLGEPFKRGVGATLPPFIPLGPVDPYNPAAYHSTQNVPLGSVGHRTNFKQTCETCPLAPYFPVGFDVGVPRNMDSYYSDMWHSPMHDAMSKYVIADSVNPYYIEKIAQQFVQSLFQRGLSTFFKNIDWSVLGEDLALNGYKPWGIRRVTGDSAAGPPSGGTREARYNRITQADLSYTYELKPGPRAEYQKYMTELATDGCTAVWLNAFPKTGECGEPGKNVRIVFGIGDIPYLALRVIIAPIVGAIKARKDITGCRVGFVATDHEDIADFVRGLDRVVDTDFSSWDKRLLPVVSRSVLQSFATCLEGIAPEWYCTSLRNISEDLAYPFVKWNTDWVLHHQGWGSGVAYTSELNSLFLAFTYYYAFVRSSLESNFWEAQVRTYGDDGVLGVSADVDFQLDKLREYAAELNQSVTYSVGKNGSAEWTDVTQIHFLKRSFEFRDGLWYAPLVKESIYRPTQYWEPSKSVPPHIQLNSILDTVLLETFICGEDEFNRATSMAKAASEGLMLFHVPKPFEWYKTWYASKEPKDIWSN